MAAIRAMFCLPLLATLAAVVPAGELGRLFYSPQQRRLIDANRPLGDVSSGQEAMAEQDGVTLRGVLRRRDGKATLWLNDTMQAAGTAPNAAQALVTLPDGSRVPMTVGDKWQSGALQPPAVTVQRNAPAR